MMSKRSFWMLAAVALIVIVPLLKGGELGRMARPQPLLKGPKDLPPGSIRSGSRQAARSKACSFRCRPRLARW